MNLGSITVKYDSSEPCERIGKFAPKIIVSRLKEKKRFPERDPRSLLVDI